MNRLNYTAAQWAALQEAAADRLAFNENVRRVLTIAGEDFSGFIEDFGYGKEEGVAVVLELVLNTPLDDTYEQEIATVEYLALRSGELLPAFEGKVVKLRDDGTKTTLVAATGAYESARTPMGDGPADDREYTGARPDLVLYEAFSVLYGEYNGIEIMRAATPLINANGADRIKWNQYVSDLIGVAADQGYLIGVDLATNIASAYQQLSLDQVTEEVWTFEEEVDTERNGIAVETPEAERYAWVIVWRGSDDSTGDNIPLTKPIKVDNGTHNVNPRSVFFVEFTNEVAAEGLEPYEIGRREAVRLGTNEARVTINPKYPPFFLSRGDIVLAIKKTPVEGGVKKSSYRVLLDTVPVEGQGGSPAGEAQLLSEEIEATPLPEFPSQTSLMPALWGFSTDGRPFFDDSLPWVSRELGEDGVPYLVLDDEIAANHGVTVTEDPGGQRVVEVSDDAG